MSFRRRARWPPWPKIVTRRWPPLHFALGHIGDANAARVLMKLQSASPAALTLPLDDAPLRAAGRLAATPDKSLASRIINRFRNNRNGLWCGGPVCAACCCWSQSRPSCRLRSSPGEEQPLIAQLVVDLPAREDARNLSKVRPSCRRERKSSCWGP